MNRLLASTRAVLFDLDDTLYLQSHYLQGAWRAVAAVGAHYGVAAVPLEAALNEIASEGSDRGRIIDRALARVGANPALAPMLVKAFREHAPDRLPLIAGVAPLLLALGKLVPIGLITDGNARIQRAKLHALRLGDRFDVCVFSDELGREFRKPSAVPFRRALTALGCPAEAAVFVGDRPDKDIAGAGALGIRTIRVLTGEYSHVPDTHPPDFTAVDASEALRMLLAASVYETTE